MLRAYSASGTLTVQEESVQFTSKKINLDLTGEELHRLEWGRMRGDFVKLIGLIQNSD